MTAKPLTLKPLTTNLLPAALLLDQQCFGGLWTESGYRREIESPNSDLLILSTVMNGDEVFLGIGCYWAILEEAHVTILGIAPEYQRQGLGQALFYALLFSSQQRQLERATLEVRISNQSALALYQKFGFREAGRRKRYYQDTGEDALVLWRGGLQLAEFSEVLQVQKEAICDRLYQSGWQFPTTIPQPMVKEAGLTW